MVNSLLHIADWLLFLYTGVSVAYLAIFSFASLFYRKKKHIHKKEKVAYKFAVIVPAYKEDAVIIDAVRSIIKQDYPRDRFNVTVVADGMKDETLESLHKFETKILNVDYPLPTKAKALNFALNNLEDEFDFVIILDADNICPSDYLSRINEYLSPSTTVLQTHRTAKKINTPYAMLDAVSEEMNNSIFRKGHTALGMSAALIGSGMVFRFDWFKENMPKVTSIGEDKELEFLLLQQQILIDYSDTIYVLDEKIDRPKSFYNQRRRWLAAQFSQLRENFPDLLTALQKRNINLADKIFQQMLLPRLLLLGLTFILAILFSFAEWNIAYKWWILLTILIITLIIAIPKRLKNKALLKSLFRLPLLFILMFLNLFRLKGASKKFIHTEHK
ncbi:MAG: glycosyltransferase family 2 protein [Bacteroidales bacterium]|nr:glycosyltransferase family 2 protein [Bacteroidales bacterium]